MALPAPKLDDRAFQDIVQEARSKIPLYCPKWTDYNLSDPGITLIELFAWMVDMLLYRLNRVPEKNYIKFMDLIGIKLEPPVPAEVDVVFRLSTPQPEAITIPKGTEVATVRTETQEAISFMTDRDLTIIIPDLAYVLTTSDDASYEDRMPALKNPDITIPVFDEVPKENNALYLGFRENLAAHTLYLTINSNVEGIGVDPRHPPLVWECWDGEYERWIVLRFESDTTGGLNTAGNIIVHLPHNAALNEINGQNAFWIRCRAIQPEPGQRAYSSSPKLRSLLIESLGGAVSASHAFQVTNELLGRSNGTPGQSFYLQNTPVLKCEPEEKLEVETETEGEFELWQEVANFYQSGPDDRHYTLDNVSGEVKFGPSIRRPTGEERQYGKVPVIGRMIRFTSYRSGGGVVGNVGEETIKVLKSSIPYLDSVINYQAASGGRDAETLESAKLRAPQELKARTRAVTAEDFEYLAVEASSMIARAKCIPAGGVIDGQTVPSGVVQLLLVPEIANCDRLISREELEIPRQAREEVQEYLDERRLLGTRLDIATPKYLPVAVEARIKKKAGFYTEQVMTGVEKKLCRYINPVCGGADESGWPFGRSITLSEVYAAIQGTAGVDFIEEAKLLPVDSESGEQQSETTRIDIPPDGLVYSSQHRIVVE